MEMWPTDPAPLESQALMSVVQAEISTTQPWQMLRVGLETRGYVPHNTARSQGPHNSHPKEESILLPKRFVKCRVAPSR